MKKCTVFLFLVIASIATTWAQEQVQIVIDEEPTEINKNYGGYILNLDKELIKTPQWELPKFELMPQFNVSPAAYLYNLSGANSTTFGQTDFSYNRYSLTPWGRFNNIDGPINSATFKLKSGLNISTYGDYDADGYKRRIPSAYPWKNNNFRGGFELKSNNGKFGFRVDLEHGRGNPYGPNW